MLDDFITWLLCDVMHSSSWCVAEYWYEGGDAYCPSGGISQCG